MRTILQSIFPIFFIAFLGRETASWDGCLPTSRVVGGEHINIKDAPFVLRMELLFFSNSSGMCGASILSEKIALTAAHCAKYCTYPFVTCRVVSGSTGEEDGNIHYVKKIVIHENYVPGDYDTALLFVIEPFQFSDSVQPIKLPTKELKEGTLAMTAGYGKVDLQEFLGWPSSNALKRSIVPIAQLNRVTVPIIDRYICNATLAEIQKPKNKIKIVTERLMCAGYPGGKYDHCEGDSGGPLYLNGTIYGVVSWGLGCAQECAPGVYMNVYKFLDWINTTIEKNKEEYY